MVAAGSARRRWLAVGFCLLSAFFAWRASYTGWGGATIGGDRVKWGLRSMGRSPFQSEIVVSDFCQWLDGLDGLCAIEPGAPWAGFVLQAAYPLALAVVAVLAGCRAAASVAVLPWPGGRRIVASASRR